ncbi:MAG: hypothetical protein ACLPVY_15270 [Acidimicrobiia bacterium]
MLHAIVPDQFAYGGVQCLKPRVRHVELALQVVCASLGIILGVPAHSKSASGRAVQLAGLFDGFRQREREDAWHDPEQPALIIAMGSERFETLSEAHLAYPLGSRDLVRRDG